MQKDREASKVAAGTLYASLVARAVANEKTSSIDQVEPNVVFGSEVKKAIFNYVCPETQVLVSTKGFNVHGNITESGELEAMLTVECRSCKKEHPITVISFPMESDKN